MMRITKQAVQGFFASLHAKGVDTNQTMLWSFFFTHHDEEPFHRARPKLEALGYEWVDILGPDDDEDAVLFLQLDILELHTPRSLWKRCKQLSRFADDNGLETFDGFDIGRPDGQPLYK